MVNKRSCFPTKPYLYKKSKVIDNFVFFKSSKPRGKNAGVVYKCTTDNFCWDNATKSYRHHWKAGTLRISKKHLDCGFALKLLAATPKMFLIVVMMLSRLDLV